MLLAWQRHLQTERLQLARLRAWQKDAAPTAGQATRLAATISKRNAYSLPGYTPGRSIHRLQLARLSAWPRHLQTERLQRARLRALPQQRLQLARLRALPKYVAPTSGQATRLAVTISKLNAYSWPGYAPGRSIHRLQLARLRAWQQHTPTTPEGNSKSKTQADRLQPGC
jgi:SLT domain-containing protein